MNVIQEKLLADGEFVNQVASLVGVIADKLPSNGKLSDEIESVIKDKVEESISDQDVDVGAIVDQKMDDYDIDYKIDDYDMSDKIDDYDMSYKIDEYDMSDKIDEYDMTDKVEGYMFSFFQQLMLKLFESDTETWLDTVKRAAVTKHLADEKARAEEAPPSVLVEV